MNYKVLYRKYRPDNFDSLVGQKHIVEILKNSIKEKRIAHAYLFSGPRGTGKTSTARILAKSINCKNNEKGISCGKCEVCTSFNSNPDIIEIDAASNNGVEEIRELINNVKIMPTNLKYKVYIIDEVHMLSQSAFNALLLTLEEPPEHVIFILATTNLESVPITIVSRCQRFDFRKISDNDIIERLKYICEEEKIKYEIDGLKEIASLADGGLRDALSLLDQLSKSDEIISSEFVTKEIGSVSEVKIKQLVESIDNNDVEKLESIFEELESINLNYKVVIKKIIYAISKVAVNILENKKDYRLRYDDWKHLVIELNDMLNKININVNPYILIKMIILSYVKIENKKEVKKEVIEEAIPKVVEEKQKKVMPSQQMDELVDIRINNCFVKATKNALNEMKVKWEDFVNSLEVPLKGSLLDTVVVTSSDEYMIIECNILHLDEELNQELNKIEDLFNKYSQKQYKIIFISKDKWEEERKKYINNLKNKVKYIMRDENKDSKNKDIDMSVVADVFDINKIEIE